MAVFVLNVKIFVLNVKIAVVYDIAGSQQIGCWISWLCQVTIELEFQNLITFVPSFGLALLMMQFALIEISPI